MSADEQSIDMDAYTKVAEVDEIPEGRGIGGDVDGI